ncbi:aminoglycoside 6'-N-acetyltransferase [Bacillus pakistanensis]|uniref:Aminoglycoside 6'-N-acetyltransferase n=1 Tax=Rossellomorea pakistanensis TaxID=992288 RepID=A0ABS2NA54_9BACI|nr:NUDIX hydrolase [Bacillus pakistanensis]MBM7584456.1 aminoglycoside 6'-N-acetyltransferase [Bacillus pakistanensis]
MKKWFGSAGICLNEKDELLMVLQGRSDELKKWSVPTGGLEENETFSECCIREMEEETGYIVELIEEIHVKKGIYEERNLSFEVHYFLVNVIGGQPQIQDPDHLIYDIDWKSKNEINDLELTYPEDRKLLMDYIQGL